MMSRRIKGYPAKRGGRKLGKDYGNDSRRPDVERMQVWNVRIPQRPKKPLRPYAGANYTTTQLVPSFSVSTGVTFSAGSSFITQSGATALLGQVAFTMADLAQLSSFAALFDQYRVEKIKLRIQSRNNAVDVANTASPNNTVPY